MTRPDIGVFISFKNSDNGVPTEDREIGKALWSELKLNDIESFYSNVSLQQFGDAVYKESIETALDKAIVFVVIGTKLDFLNSPWVQYERERFHTSILNGTKKNGVLLSYTKDIAPSELPGNLQIYQNFAIGRDPVERIVEFIKNYLAKYSQDEQTDQTIGIAAQPSPSPWGGQRGKSVYDSEFGNELNRLRIQAENSYSTDKIALDYLKTKLPERPVSVLDVGSAYGFVAESRFGQDPHFDKVLCIDSNEKVIEDARRMNANDKLSFSVLDVESARLEQDLEALLEAHGLTSIDVVYSALTIHHLKDPLKVLRRLRKYMTRGGYVFLRGSDDGSKLDYPDEKQLMRAIIDRTMSAPGVSDRLNGRKIYSQLVDSGFDDIRIFSSMRDLSGLDFDAREALFQESFAYRIDYFAKQCAAHPEDFEARESWEWMRTALELFEDEFHKKNFWYSEFDFIGIGRK